MNISFLARALDYLRCMKSYPFFSALEEVPCPYPACIPINIKPTSRGTGLEKRECTNTCTHREEGLLQKMLCPSCLLGVGQKTPHEFLKKQKAEFKKTSYCLKLISSLEKSMEKQNCQPPVRLGGSNQALELA